MKQCIICSKDLGWFQGPKKYCSKECQQSTWKKQCKWCNNSFVPSEERVLFCSRTCASKWKWTVRGYKEKLYASIDLSARGKAISKSIQANPEEKERRRKLMLKMQPIYAERNRRNGVTAFGGYGIGHKPTPSELILKSHFPNASFNFPVKTGLSSKLRNAQQYWIDFAWPDIKLAVEVDGNYHSSETQKKRDSDKDSFLTSLGWKVIRFSTVQVLNNTRMVIVAIKKEISDLSM